MYKVVLLDDQSRITRGLKEIIGWERLGCQVVGEANNGLQGLELIDKTSPDIVITDIRMPKMDGLQMIKVLKQRKQNVEFIILSGYSEFEYAKKGMELGVNFYILKPVDENVFEECLQNVCNKIAEQKQRKDEFLEYKRKSSDRQEEFSCLALREIVDGSTDNAEEIQDLLYYSNIKLDGNSFNCILIEFDDISRACVKKYLKDIKSIIARGLAGFFDFEAFKYSDYQAGVLIAHKEKIDFDLLCVLLEQIQKELIAFTGTNIFIGIGSAAASISGIARSFEQARDALNYKIINEKNTLFLFDKLKNLTDNTFSISKEILGELEKSIYSSDLPGSKIAVEKYFNVLLAEKKLRTRDIQLQCLFVIIAIASKMRSIQFDLNEFVGRDILSLNRISRFKTAEEIKNWLINVISIIIEMGKIPKSVQKDTFDEIKEYIQTHYFEGLSLNTIAEHFYFNPYYLSQLFKKKTGESYLTYVTKIRMKKAKELLMTTDLKIYEICNQIGYESTRYFNKTFEKLVGCRPTEYRTTRLI